MSWSLRGSCWRWCCEHFADAAAGGFYFTSDDHEALIHRSKVFGDDATPAGNGIAARVLLRMGYLLGEPRYLAAAERTLRAAWPALVQHPPGARRVCWRRSRSCCIRHEIVILRGEASAIEGWRKQLARLYAPRRLVLAIPADAADLPRRWRTRPHARTRSAYVCRGSTCSAP